MPDTFSCKNETLIGLNYIETTELYTTLNCTPGVMMVLTFVFSEGYWLLSS